MTYQLEGSSYIEVAFIPDSGTGEARDSQADRTRFYDLADWWHAETDGLSIDAQKYEHEAYERIMEELGVRAVPYMLEDLKDRGGHWYSALRHLTGEEVDAAAKGSMRRARDLWLQWARANHKI